MSARASVISGWLLFVVSMAGVASVTVSGQQFVAPTVVSTVQPTYPEAAKAGGIDGTVQFAARVREDGTVERVDIASVPKPDLGFERAVTAAVMQWRFSPGTMDGKPIPSAYAGSVRFELTLPGEAIFAVSSRDAWTAVRALVRELKIPVERTDDAHQLIITGPARYLAFRLPDASTLGLSPGFAPERFQLHIYVSPVMEPARVAVGSVMDLEAISSNDVRHRRTYAQEHLSSWFFQQLALRLRVRMEPLSASAALRADQSRILMPAGTTDRCSTSPSPSVSIDAATGRQPEAISRYQPDYPRDQIDERRQGRIIIHGEVTEHGTLAHPKLVQNIGMTESFAVSAQVAFGLWRFTPARVNGCPVRAEGTFTADYRLK
jgi:protein TonB